jgi:bacteriocin-like protein
MRQAEFRAALESDEKLQHRFVADPKAVLDEYQVSDELTEEELESISGGSPCGKPEFVHSLLSSIFKEGG